MKGFVRLLMIMLLLSIFAMCGVYAQQNTEQDIKVIRDLYRQAQEFVKHDNIGDPTVEYHLSMSLQRLYPVGGPQTQNYDFYFDHTNNKDGNLIPRLKFIRMKSETGGLLNEEYLFNDKEELIFYFSKFNFFVDLDNDEAEMRLYYKDGTLIRNLLKTTAHRTKKATDHTTIPDDYKPILEFVPKEAGRLKGMFKNAIEFSLWEMMVN